MTNVRKRLAVLFVPFMMLCALLACFLPCRAYGVPVSLTVYADPYDAGAFWVNDAINENYTYKSDFDYGDYVYLCAVETTDMVFDHWEIAETGFHWTYKAETNYQLQGDTTMIAVFKDPPTVSGTIDSDGGGYVSCNAMGGGWGTSFYSPNINKGYEVNAYANSESGYEFMWWEDSSGTIISYDQHISFYAYYDFYYKAHFEKVPEPLYYVYLDLNDYSGGWVSGHMGSGYSGDWLTVEATPAAGYKFAGWTETGTGFPVSPDAAYTFPIYSDQYYTANFKAEDAPITIVTLPGEGSGVMPDYTVADGDTFYLPECTYTAPYGKEFAGWDVGDVGDGIVMHSDMTITAQWKDKSTFTVHVEPNGGTGYMPDPEIAYGEEYTLPEIGFAAPEGKVFDGWDAGAAGEKITVYGETWIYAQWKDPEPSTGGGSSGSGPGSSSPASSGAASTGSASSGAASSGASSSSSSASSASASSGSASSSSASGQSSAGSSGQGSGTAAQGGFDLASSLPLILGGVVVLLLGVIIGLLLKRGKDEKGSGKHAK